MLKLIITVGLPASGKSLWASDLVRKDARFVRVNRDEIRTMIHGDVWNQKREKTTMTIRDAMIEAAFAMGKNVICDDTNLNPGVVAKLKALAEKNGAEVSFERFTHVTPEECIKRDLKRAKSVGADVIWKMYRDYLLPFQPIHDFTLPKAIIVDMDGTLSHIHAGRTPYQDDLAADDHVNHPVAQMVRSYLAQNPDVKFIVMSGRDEGRSREATLKWFETSGCGLTPDLLFMRPACDVRPDNIVKRELYDTHVQGAYCVQFVVDDRDQVVRMWRDDLGLPTFQVNWGAF